MTIPADLLEFFVDHAESQIVELQKAAAQQSTEEVRRLAHNLNGSAAQFGFEQLSEHARRIELAAQSKDRNAVNAALRKLLDDPGLKHG